MVQVGSKLSASCAIISPRRPCLAQAESFWKAPGSIFHHVFGDLWKNDRSVKTINARSLLVGFLVLEAVLGGFQDVVFLAILGDVVASWCQDGAQERQDEGR